MKREVRIWHSPTSNLPAVSLQKQREIPAQGPTLASCPTPIPQSLAATWASLLCPPNPTALPPWGSPHSSDCSPLTSTQGGSFLAPASRLKCHLLREACHPPPSLHLPWVLPLHRTPLPEPCVNPIINSLPASLVPTPSQKGPPTLSVAGTQGPNRAPHLQ